MWRSWLAHHVRDVGVGRSSRLIPTKGVSRNRRPLFVRYIIAFGKWRSWLARCVRDAEVGCSSHLFPTKGHLRVPFCRGRGDAPLSGPSPRPSPKERALSLRSLPVQGGIFGCPFVVEEVTLRFQDPLPDPLQRKGLCRFAPCRSKVASSGALLSWKR